MTSTIAARLPKGEIKELELYAKEEGVEKSAFIKKLIYESLREYKIKRAFKLYGQKRISLGKVADIAGVDLWEVYGLMKKYKVNLTYGINEFREDINENSK